jgi:hypothetical protein
LWNEVLLPAAGAPGPRGLVFAHPFTDDEEELRNRAWRFVMPAHERAWFDAHVSGLVRIGVLPASAHPADPSSYYRALMSEEFASPASRFRRLGEDAEADLRLIDPFAATATRVMAADRVRLHGLVFVRDLTEAEIYDAAVRVAENRCLIAWVRDELVARTQDYRYALEHGMIAMPQHQAVGAERAIRALEIHRRTLDDLQVPAWRHGACLVPAIAPGTRRPGPLVAKG